MLQRKFNTATLFAIASVSLIVSGYFTELVLGKSAIDIQLHDTMFVIAYFHIYVGIGLFFGLLGLAYYYYPLLFDRYMNESMGKIHFFITFIGICLILLPMHYMNGLPRRYYTYANFETFNNFNNLAAFISGIALIVFFAQLLFIGNFLYSIFKGRKVVAD